ncbi:nucleomorphin-like isoform X2 [Tetranychus urticae]|nr:nucleomorphin-like isoform X2 [Tetranychus urticae]
MAILGKGSMRDKKKEEDLQNSGDPKYHHLNEDLHVEISAFAPPAEAYSRVGHALHQVQRFLVPDYYDDIRQQQLRELGVLSVNRKPSGSYHSTESTENGEEEKDEKDEDEDDPIDQEQGIDEQENENENRVVKCNHENDEAEIYSSQLTSQLKLIKDCHQIHHNQHNHHHHHYNHRKPEQHKTHQNYSTQVGHNFHSQQPFPSNQHHYQHQQLKCPNCLPNLLSSSLGGKLKMTKPVPIKFTSSSLSSSTLEPSSFTCEYEMSTKRCSCPHPFDTENSDETWNTQRTCKTIRNRFQLMPYSKRTRKLYD